MRLYYLEMKRLIRTKSVWILMIAMVVLAAVIDVYKRQILANLILQF